MLTVIFFRNPAAGPPSPRSPWRSDASAKPGRSGFSHAGGPILMIFLFFAGISIFFAFSKGLAIYNFIRLVLMILTALAAAKILKEGIVKLESVLAAVAASAVFQSLIAFFQFWKQSGLGLKVLGEPILAADLPGIAKIVVEGIKFIRGYGTFPHPNVLAAFLLLGLISIYYFYLRNYEKARKSEKFILSGALFIVLLGLILTFSRTAWMIAILLTSTMIIYALFNKRYRGQAAFLLFTLLASGYILAAIFSPYIFSRIQVSGDEPAVVLRLAYNQIGLNLISARPLGVGVGNQVLYAIKNDVYQKFGLDQSWQWQPIHNIYLLMASEIGIGGAALFIIFILSLFLNQKFKVSISNKISPFGRSLAGRQNPNSKNFEIWILKFGFFSLLLFGFFDHFLWTLQPGRLMFWLTVGLLLFLNKQASPFDKAPLDKARDEQGKPS